jgi:hypothetical protein
MMEALSTSETSHFYLSPLRMIPKDSHVQIDRRENLENHILSLFFLQKLQRD